MLFVIRALCKHNPETADAVAKSGGLETLILCLEDFEIAVSFISIKIFVIECVLYR